MKCANCEFSIVIQDPDPHDWFNLDDQAICCKRVLNDKRNNKGDYLSDDAEFKPISVSIRPYEVKRVEAPDWCPINKKEIRDKKINNLLMTNIEEVYNEIKELDLIDKCTTSEAVCKFVEESGEWIREINKTTGRKTYRESKEEVLASIKEEAADTLQNLLLLCNRFDISIEELLDEVKKKNNKWRRVIPERQKV